MPRHSEGHSRFNPTFGERLRQSLISRGLEPAPVAPAPVAPAPVAPAPEGPSLYEVLEATMAAYVSTSGTYRQLAEQMRRQVMQEAHEARVQGNRIHLIAHDEMLMNPGSITTPTLQPPKEKVAMQNPTEQTMITVLQQGVADAIRYANVCKELMAAYGAKVTESSTYNLKLPDEIAVAECWHDVATPNHDEFSPMTQLDTYSRRKRILAHPLVLRHSAVIAALKDAGFSVLGIESLVIHDYVEFFKANELRFATVGESAHPHPLHDIPQLGCTRGHLKVLTAGESGGFTAFEPLWKAREQRRIEGKYTPLPKEIADALGPQVMGTYFPHLATKSSNAGMIAFTQSATAGILDRQQVIKPGRFLRQHLPDASDEQIKQYAAACLGALSAGIHHSKEADDFERVYLNGPSSCMSYDRHGKSFNRLMVNDEFYHPTRVYAHPENNIEIVWLEVAGRIAARAVVNTASKQYPTMYGNDSVKNAASRLENYLENLGYHRDDCALDDEKLLLVHTDQGAIICPYIDAGNRGVHIESDCLVVGGSHEANHETGCLHDYDSEDADWYCDDCGDGQNEYDERYRTYCDETICEHCRQNYTEAYNAESEEYVWVPDYHDDLFVDQTPGRRGGQIYMGDGHGDYRLLNDTYYASGQVAHEDHVVSHEDGDYVLRSDLDRFNLFFNNEICEACEVDEYAVFDDDLVVRTDVPDDAVICTDETDDDYPMLPVYRSVDEDDQEEAA